MSDAVTPTPTPTADWILSGKRYPLHIGYYQPDETLICIVGGSIVPRVGEFVQPPGSSEMRKVVAIQWTIAVPDSALYRDNVQAFVQILLGEPGGIFG